MEEAMDSSGPGVTEIHGILLAMQKNLECPICLEVMQEPVSTPCAHVFCRFCILKLLEQKKGIRKTKCPLCNVNITRRTLREDVRFKLVIKGIWEAFGALECDTGFKFLGDRSLHKKAMEAASSAVPQETPTIVESKGYRDRQNGAKKGEKRNRALQGKNSNLSLPNRTVTRSSLRKKSNSNKTLCFEIGSDSSEDPFQKTGTVRCMGLRSSSWSQGGERHAEKRSRSPGHMELQEPSAEDVLLDTPGACGLSEARAGSTEGLQASTGNVDAVEELAAVEKRQNLSFPVPCLRRRSRRLVSSSTEEGGCCSLLGMKQCQLAGEATNSVPNKQAGTEAETVHIVQPAGSAQICNFVCEDQQELPQPQASPGSPLSQVSGKKLKQSIQKVNEWFSKSKILSPTTTLQDAHTEEGDLDLSPHLSDVDSHVSQKTELREDQWEVTTECEVGRALPKPDASKMVVDKIFGRTYKRARKCNPIWNPRDTIHIPAEERCSTMNTKSCDPTIRKISVPPKATLEQSSEDIMKKQTVPEDSEGPIGDVNAVLEEDGHDLAAVDETPGAEPRAADLPVRERASSCESDASPISCHSCSLQNLKKTRGSLSKRSRRPVRQVCALQSATCGSSGSPDKTQAQAHGNPSSEGPRDTHTEKMHIRRSKRLMSRVEGEQRRSEPAEKRRKQLEEGEKKQKESQAESASPSLAEDGPGVLQGRQAGLAGDASQACAVSDEKGSPSVEHPPESYNPCPIVPDTGSQASCSLLQYHLAAFEQTALRDKEFTVAPQAEQSALCAQAPEGNDFCLGDVKQSCKTPRAMENWELNPGTDDSELDAGFMWKIFHHCKRQSFLLYPDPVKKSAAGPQMDLSIDQAEGDSEADRVKKSNPGIDRVSKETGEAVAGRVAKSIPGLSLISHPTPSPEHKSGSEHLQAASQALFPDSSRMPVDANKAKSENPLWSQKPGNDQKESLEMEKTTNENSCSCGTSGRRRSGNSLDPSLHPTDETRSKAAHFLEVRPNSADNKALTCSSCPELTQPFPVAGQRCPSESSSGSVEKTSRVGEQKRLKGTGEQTVQMLSTGVSGGHLEQSPQDETPDFPLLSDTPEGLLGPATKSSLNHWEGDQQDTLATFAETDQVSPHERDLECSSSSSESRPEDLVQAGRRRVQKLSSSSEENSSEDEDLPCFQALVFGRLASTSSQPVKEEATSADILVQNSSRQSSPRSQRAGGSPSQESECSVNLFSSQSCASVDSPRKPCDARPLTPVPTSQGKAVTPRVAEHLGEISRDAGQLEDGHQDSINAGPNLGEALGYDSEASHLGDSSGFSSQSEILTTQQKDMMQNNLKKLQEEMAVLEAALKEGGQDAALERSPLPSEERGLASSENQKTSHWNCASSDGLPATPESPVNTKSPEPVAQQGQEPGSAMNLRCGSKQSIISASSPAGNTHRTPDDYSTSSSTSQEHIACCLATEPERQSPIAIQDKSSPPEHESQGKPVSSFNATAICSSRKRKPKSLLLTSKRHMSLVASGLFPDELRLVQKFARKTRSTWSTTVSNDTTHVVMKTDEDLVCERTLKYFLGIAAQKWVVSYQWVLQSLKEGRVLNEGDFEVRGDIINGRNHQGPKRARESSAGKLFQGLEICCYGPFTDMQKEQLEWMVELCGASLVKQPHLFSCSTNSVDAVVVIQPDAWAEDTGCQGIPPPCSATVLTREWVLDSVSCYRCLAFSEYLVQQV